MTTALLTAVTRKAGGAFNLEQLALDEPDDDEMLVRIAGVGLCHTDLAAVPEVAGQTFGVLTGLMVQTARGW